MATYFTVYSTHMPANTLIYVDEFRKLIQLDMISPDTIIDLFIPGFSINRLIGTTNDRMTSA